MHLLRLILATLVAVALAPSAAQAAPPWSDPANLGQGANPVVLGDIVAFNGPGSIPGAPLLRSVNGAPATVWDSGRGAFDTQFGAFGSAKLYIGPKGRRVEIARGSGAGWKFSFAGPRTGGARVAAAPGAAAFSTFEAGDVGRVYLVRGTHATQRLSDRGHIRAVAVATNARGDVLVAWDLRGTVEARLWHAGRLGSVRKLGTVTAAMHISAALSAGGRPLVAWVDQRVNEGASGMHARIQESVGFGRAKTLEVFPDFTIPSGEGVEAAYVGHRGLVAWSGRHAVRAAFVGGTPQDVAPVGPDTGYAALGLTDLAVSPAGALIAIGAPIDATHNQVLASLLGANGFGPASAVSAPGEFLGRATAGFDGQWVVAWSGGGTVSRATASP